MALPNPGMDFTAFDTLPAASLDDMVENIEALADGSGLDDKAIATAKLDDGYSLLGYTERTSSFTSTTAGSMVDVTSLTVTFTTDGTQRVELMARIANLSSTQTGLNGLQLRIAEGATEICTSSITQNSANWNLTVEASRIITPSAGSHTYKVQVLQQSAGTITVAGSATNPSYISARLV